MSLDGHAVLRPAKKKSGTTPGTMVVLQPSFRSKAKRFEDMYNRELNAPSQPVAPGSPASTAPPASQMALIPSASGSLRGRAGDNVVQVANHLLAGQDRLLAEIAEDRRRSDAREARADRRFEMLVSALVPRRHSHNLEYRARPLLRGSEEERPASARSRRASQGERRRDVDTPTRAPRGQDRRSASPFSDEDIYDE